jgi:hypothetical protein
MFLGFALGSCAAVLLSKQRRVIFMAPFLGVTLLTCSLLYFSNEQVLSVLIPLCLGGMYAPLALLLFEDTFRARYWLDLISCLIGFLFGWGLLGIMGGEWLLVLCGSLALIVALLSYERLRAQSFYLLATVFVVGILILQYERPLLNIAQQAAYFPAKFAYDPTYDVFNEKTRDHFSILATRWSGISRVDIVQRTDAASTTALFYDRMRWTTFPTTTAPLFYGILSETSVARGKALVIGVGAGRDILALEHMGFSQIDAAEINDATYHLLRGPFASLAHDVYNRHGVTNADGRAFLEARTEHRYDVITLPRPDLINTQFASFVSLDSYLYTQEATKLFWERLTDTGVLWLTRGAVLEKTSTNAPALFKNAATFLAFLEESSIATSTHLFVFSEISPDTSVDAEQNGSVRRMAHFLLTKHPLSESEQRKLVHAIQLYTRDPHFISPNLAAYAQTPLWESELCVQQILTRSSICDVDTNPLTDAKPFLWTSPSPQMVLGYLSLSTNMVFVAILFVLVACIFHYTSRGVNTPRRLLVTSLLSGLLYGFLTSFFYYKVLFLHHSPLVVCVAVQSAMILGSLVSLRLISGASHVHIKRFVYAALLLVIGISIISPQYIIPLIPTEAVRLLVASSCIALTTSLLTTIFPFIIQSTTQLTQDQKRFILSINLAGIAFGIFMTIITTLVWGIPSTAILVVLLTGSLLLSFGR